MTKMKASEQAELESLQAKGRMHCRDYFGGFLKKDGFYRTMKEYPYTDEALEESFTPSVLYPSLPGTAESILGWGLGCGYIDQEDYDVVMGSLEKPDA